MKRKLGLMAAKWLAKRENRETMARTAREFGSRIKRDAAGNERRTGDADRRHESGPADKRDDTDNRQPRG